MTHEWVYIYNVDWFGDISPLKSWSMGNEERRHLPNARMVSVHSVGMY